MTDDPQPEPKAPPFAVGARLKFIGTRKITTGFGPGKVVLLAPGLEVEIVRVTPGERGTGCVELVDDDGYEIVNRTRDGRSIWINARNQPRAIWPDSAHEWEPLP